MLGESSVKTLINFSLSENFISQISAMFYQPVLHETCTNYHVKSL